MKEAKRLAELKQRNREDVRVKRSREKERKKFKVKIAKGGYSAKLQQAGINLAPAVWLTCVAICSIILFIALETAIGILVALGGAPCFAYYFSSTYLIIRADKRRRDVVAHLPGFIDTLSASLGTGYTMEVGLEHAANSLPDGVLKREFYRVIRMLHKGMVLDDAMKYLSTRVTGQEVISLVITVRLFSDMGGRALSPFKRLGYKIREQQAVLERAARDLVGTKQAFFVIFALSVAAPLFLIFSQTDYILTAMQHPTIKYIMQGAIVSQILCFILFKKFTSLKV